MKKIFLLFFTFASLLFCKDELLNTVEDFLHYENKLNDLNIKSDGNSSRFANEKKELTELKEKILNNLPRLISSQENNISLVFKAEKDILTQRINEAKEGEKANLHFKMMNAELDLVFYDSLLSLKTLFQGNANSQDIKNLLDENMLKIDTKIDENLNKDMQDKIDVKIKAYDEILIFLKQNAYSLQGNFIFSTLRLDDIINYINSFFTVKYINVGKIVLCIAILLFFDLLKNIIPMLIYKILVEILLSSTAKQAKQDELRDIFVKKNKKAIRLILFAYALSICVSVIYYPTPVDLSLTNAFYILYAILFTYLILGLLDSYGIILLAKLAKKSGKKEVVNLIIKIIYFIIIIISTLFILARLGFNVSAIIASLGIGGLAVALAAKDVIANFFASLLLSFDDSFNQGDWVEIGNIQGTVVETGLRKTTIRTFDNCLVFLPNSTVMSSNISNWSRRKIGRRLKMSLGLTYEAKADQLEHCVNDIREYLLNSPLVAQADDDAVKYGDYRLKYKQNLVSVNDLEGYKNACYVALSAFKDSSIDIELDFFIKNTDKRGFFEARQTIMLDLMRIVEKNNLSFAYPSLSVYLENNKA